VVALLPCRPVEVHAKGYPIRSFGESHVCQPCPRSCPALANPTYVLLRSPQQLLADERAAWPRRSHCSCTSFQAQPNHQKVLTSNTFGKGGKRSLVRICQSPRSGATMEPALPSLPVDGREGRAVTARARMGHKKSFSVPISVFIATPAAPTCTEDVIAPAAAGNTFSSSCEFAPPSSTVAARAAQRRRLGRPDGLAQATNLEPPDFLVGVSSAPKALERSQEEAGSREFLGAARTSTSPPLAAVAPSRSPLTHTLTLTRTLHPSIGSYPCG